MRTNRWRFAAALMVFGISHGAQAEELICVPRAPAVRVVAVGAAASLVPDDPVQAALAEFARATDVDERAERLNELAVVIAHDFDARLETIQREERPTCVRQMRRDLLDAAADIALLERLQQVLPGLAASPLGGTHLARQLATAHESYREAGQRVAALSNQYGLYVGSAFSLDAAGTWVPGVEALARFDKEATSHICAWALWCRLSTEISYQTIGAVDQALEAADTTTSGGGGGLPVIGGGGSTATTTTSKATDSPFLSKGGYLRFNVAAKIHAYDWLGLQMGAGASSLPDSALKVTRIVPRFTVGPDTMTVYSDGALGEVFVGYAYDKFWEGHTPHRYVVDGVFMVPGLKPKGFSIAVRLFMDGPISGHGPSEVRASLLLYQPFSDWSLLVNPLKALTGPVTGLVSPALDLLH